MEYPWWRNRQHPLTPLNWKLRALSSAAATIIITSSLTTSHPSKLILVCESSVFSCFSLLYCPHISKSSKLINNIQMRQMEEAPNAWSESMSFQYHLSLFFTPLSVLILLPLAYTFLLSRYTKRGTGKTALAKAAAKAKTVGAITAALSRSLPPVPSSHSAARMSSIPNGVTSAVTLQGTSPLSHPSTSPPQAPTPTSISPPTPSSSLALIPSSAEQSSDIDSNSCMTPLCPFPSPLSPLPSPLSPLPSALSPLPLPPLPSPLSPLPSPLSPLAPLTCGAVLAVKMSALKMLQSCVDQGLITADQYKAKQQQFLLSIAF